MKYRHWIAFVISFMIAPVMIIGALNYVIDPFSVFHSQYLPYDYELNERFNKISAIEKNHAQFNAYILGSSRSGTTSPSFLEKYLPGTRFYNFFMSGCNQYDNELILNYLITQKYDIKTIFLQIDMSDVYGYGAPEENYHAKHHPHVTQSSMPLFYLSYLTVLPVERLIKKIKVNFFGGYQTALKYDIEKTGKWIIDYQDSLMQQDPIAYIANEPSFHPGPFTRGSKGTKIKENIASLKRIKQLTDLNHIQLIVYVAPHNHNMMNTFHIQSYLDYLAQIANIVPYWDFSGYNSLTTNNAYYYESSHYTEDLAQLVIRKIFGDDPNKTIPDDFGKWVNKHNIAHHLALRKNEITHFDAIQLVQREH